MNHILRHICYDIQSDLKQTGDDREITLPKIAFYVLMVGNRIKSQHIEKRDSGAFLHIFAEVPVLTATTNSVPDLVKGRKYFELPKSIYDFHKDQGIAYVSYAKNAECDLAYSGIGFNRTKAGRPAERLYYSKYEKPSPKNPYFYRTGNYVGLLGIEHTIVKSLEVGLYSTFDPITSIDIDAPFDFPEELLPVLKKQVLDLGRFVLMVPSERTNDGDDGTKGQEVPTQKLISVNDQNMNNPQQA
jgi:hypothetical protein